MGQGIDVSRPRVRLAGGYVSSDLEEKADHHGILSELTINAGKSVSDLLLFETQAQAALGRQQEIAWHLRHGGEVLQGCAWLLLRSTSASISSALTSWLTNRPRPSAHSAMCTCRAQLSDKRRWQQGWCLRHAFCSGSLAA